MSAKKNSLLSASLKISKTNLSHGPHSLACKHLRPERSGVPACWTATHRRNSKCDQRSAHASIPMPNTDCRCYWGGT
eukprot:5421127-Amphidinium_carterae.2